MFEQQGKHFLEALQVVTNLHTQHMNTHSLHLHNFHAFDHSAAMSASIIDAKNNHNVNSADYFSHHFQAFLFLENRSF